MSQYNFMSHLAAIALGIVIGVLLPLPVTSTAKIEVRAAEEPQAETPELKIRVSPAPPLLHNGNVFQVLRLEFRETLTINSIKINEGACGINPFFEGSPKFPFTAKMGTISRLVTGCDFFVKLEINSEKGVFEKEFE